MKTKIASTCALFVLAAALSGCAADTDEASDGYFEPEATEVDESALNEKSSLVNKSYLVRGEFSLKKVGQIQAPSRALGKGWAFVTITKQFKVSAPIGETDRIAADVRIGYRTANGSFKVTQVSNRDFARESGPLGYGPSLHVARLGDVSVAFNISDFGKRSMFNGNIGVESNVAGSAIVFTPASTSGPF